MANFDDMVDALADRDISVDTEVLEERSFAELAEVEAWLSRNPAETPPVWLLAHKSREPLRAHKFDHGVPEEFCAEYKKLCDELRKRVGSFFAAHGAAKAAVEIFREKARDLNDTYQVCTVFMSDVIDNMAQYSDQKSERWHELHGDNFDEMIRDWEDCESCFDSIEVYDDEVEYNGDPETNLEEFENLPMKYSQS